MPPKFPPKGWCWHRDAQLVDPTLAAIYNPIPLDREVAVWKCPACQNVAQLVRA